MKVTIMGVKKSQTKSGKTAYTYYGTKDFTNYEVENCECTGSAVVSDYCYEEFPVVPGDVVDFEYEPGFEDKATLVGIKMLQPFGKQADKK